MLSRSRWITTLAALAALSTLCPAASLATSAFGKAPGDDVASSMGVFRIVVDTKWRAWFNANMAPGPFWNPSSGRLTSPVMYDGSTTIGRSAAHLQGSGADGGTPVGTAGTNVGDGQMTFPPGFNTANPTRYEVHTEVRRLELVNSRNCDLTLVCGGPSLPLSVKAGSFWGLPLSPGEIESNSKDGFPAKSFFDVFIEVDLGSGIGGFGPIENQLTDPLIVAHDPINNFPPRVVYMHENPTAVPVYFKNAGSTGIPPILPWAAGERFGYLVLAGHAEDLSCADSSMTCDQLWNHVTSQKEMKPAGVPGVTGWSLAALAALMVLAGIYVASRRRAEGPTAA